ncbi:hypothetical protein H5123_17220 [Shewanella sp. SR43-4]|uniref:glycoside hydrolase family protein n=1 Tax=Shewanella sp. SR43-4 TaxID=2760942 RepID=UPI0015FA88CB|nr:hypothetical protein [Shewanella sp. SR43-4]MBB1319368.1 hypothetical protein [Shewanella sp. SR43-4]
MWRKARHIWRVFTPKNSCSLYKLETACFGQTGHNIKLGMVFTNQQCLDMLATSLNTFDRELLTLTPPLSEGEHINSLLRVRTLRLLH